MRKIQASSPVIDRILEAKLGEPYGWCAPTIAQTVGPWFPRAFDGYSEQLEAVRSALREQLAGMTATEISSRFGFTGEPRSSAFWDAQDWHRLFRNEIDALHDSIPPWFAGGLGHPEFGTNMEYWSKIPYFTLEELVFLSVGVDPGKTTLPHIIEEIGIVEESLRVIARFLVDRKELFSRQFKKDLRDDPKITPTDFLEYVSRVNLEVDLEFFDALNAIQEKPFERPIVRHEPASPKLENRERISLLKLVIGIAIKGYSYDPSKSRNDAVTDIRNDLELLGIGLDPKTIRRYLKEAAKLIPVVDERE